MNKKILSIVMGIVFSATLAANATCPVKKENPKPSADCACPCHKQKADKADGKCPCRKQKVHKPDCKCPCHKADIKKGERPSPEAMHKEMAAKMAKEREIIYNALKLSPEQRKAAMDIDMATFRGAKPHFDKVMAEKAILHDLKAQNASKCAIAKQKHAIRAAKCEVKAYFKARDKAFTAILSRSQKASYKQLMKQRIQDFKMYSKCHKAGVPPFGPQKPMHGMPSQPVK